MNGLLKLMRILKCVSAVVILSHIIVLEPENLKRWFGRTFIAVIVILINVCTALYHIGLISWSVFATQCCCSLTWML